MKSRILDFPLSTQNAIEVLAVIKKFNNQPSLSATCKELQQSLITAINTWKSPLEVLLFLSENKDNVDLALEMCDHCFDRYKQEQSQLCEMFNRVGN